MLARYVDTYLDLNDLKYQGIWHCSIWPFLKLNVDIHPSDIAWCVCSMCIYFSDVGLIASGIQITNITYYQHSVFVEGLKTAVLMNAALNGWESVR